MSFIPSDKNIKSTVNSSSTLLTASSTFTGTGELNGLDDVMVSLKTDQNGTLYMDFSTDGTNWDSSLSFQYDTARINAPHILVKGARYYRTRFTNDSAVDQTYFRLETSYGSYNKLTAPINGTLSENFDALAVRPTDYKSEVAMGKRQGRALVNKFGYNLDVDTASAEVVAAFGGSFTVVTSTTTMDVVSSSAQDAVGGTGASYILISGIDGDYLAQEEYLTLTGTTPVTTSNSWLGINRVVVITSGSNDSNAGNITVTDTGAAAGTQAYIPIGASVTQQCIFHTQVNHNLLLDWMILGALKLSGGSSPRVIFKGVSYSRVTDTFYEIFRFSLDTSVENHLEVSPSQPFVMGGREVFYITAETNTNNTEVNARFSGVEERVS
jgi:hypothetical protein